MTEMFYISCGSTQVLPGSDPVRQPHDVAQEMLDLIGRTTARSGLADEIAGSSIGAESKYGYRHPTSAVFSTNS